MSAIERQLPICEDCAAWTIRSAWARMRRAKSLASGLLSIPSHRLSQACLQTYLLPPTQRSKAGCVRLQDHYLIRTVRYVAKGKLSIRPHHIPKRRDRL